MQGFQQAGVQDRTLESIRWGSDYLLKVHRAGPDTNGSLLVTRVGGRAGGPGGTGLLVSGRPSGQGGAVGALCCCHGAGS